MKSPYIMLHSTSNSTQPAAPRVIHESARERAARVVREFARHESKLQEWAARCTVNAIWYTTDPFGAMRSANLGIDEELICELEMLHNEYNQQRKAAPVRRTA